jgi:hypothetical protein
MIMTEDKARKAAIRRRMAQTGEPYSVARHAVDGGADPADAGARPDEPVTDQPVAAETPEEQFEREAEAAGVSAVQRAVARAAFAAQDGADRVREALHDAQEREAAETVEAIEQAAEAAQRAADAAWDAARLPELDYLRRNHLRSPRP